MEIRSNIENGAQQENVEQQQPQVPARHLVHDHPAPEYQPAEELQVPGTEGILAVDPPAANQLQHHHDFEHEEQLFVPIPAVVHDNHPAADEEAIHQDEEFEAQDDVAAPDDDDNINAPDQDAAEEDPDPDQGVDINRTIALHRPRRVAKPVIRYQAMHISLNEGIERFGPSAEQAIHNEFQQLNSIPAWTPVHVSDLSPAQRSKVIKTLMFLKDKYRADGTFDKIKARLVARGDMQRGLSEQSTSSPTASTTAAFMNAAIAAKEHRHVATVDVTGAFLNAPMSGEEVFVQLDRKLAQMACKVSPEYRDFIDPSNGTLVLQLQRALYGTQQASLLWYNKLTEILTKLGFVPNSYEVCVMNKGSVGGRDQITITIYVDDLLITAMTEEDLNSIIELLKKELKNITVHRGQHHSYLGMNFNFSIKGQVEINMSGYVEDLLRNFATDLGTVSTPALSNLFEVDADAVKLSLKDSKTFHTCVAKLLYLAKRVRPDILLVVNFLTTRVKEPNETDQAKLIRVLKYLKGTSELGIKLCPAAKIGILAHVDSSYACHPDFKGQTGIVISLGSGPIFVRSSKQKLVARSSTESELIGLADGSSQVIWSREYLTAQGYKLDESVIYQDNSSTIALANKGRSTSDATRHINVRFFFVNEKIKEGVIKLIHKPTEQMIADILTKPLQGKLFKDLRTQLLNWQV